MATVQYYFLGWRCINLLLISLYYVISSDFETIQVNDRLYDAWVNKSIIWIEKFTTNTLLNCWDVKGHLGRHTHNNNVPSNSLVGMLMILKHEICNSFEFIKYLTFNFWIKDVQNSTSNQLCVGNLGIKRKIAKKLYLSWKKFEMISCWIKISANILFILNFASKLLIAFWRMLV